MPVAEAWARTGLALLWGAEALRDLARPEEILPLRALFGWRDSWPEEPPSNGGRALVAAGLEATLDCLSPDDAKAWLESDLRDLVLGFQDAYQGQCALILWVPSGRDRMKCAPPDDSWLWAAPGDLWLPLGRCLFAGAAKDLRPIPDPMQGGARDGTGPIGLHQLRLA